MTYVALITGASSGIGEQTARRLAQEPDVHLVLAARREDRLIELAEELPCPTAIFAADLTDVASPARLADLIERQHGQLNLLVNNAGARWSGEFAEAGWHNLERHMRVNFEAPARLIEALLPLLRRTAAAAAAGPLTGGADQPSRPTTFAGRPLKAPVAIVNITSTSARIARRGTSGYSASKFAMAGFNDSLSLELAPLGIHVGNVLPGFIRTEGFPQSELREHWLSRRLVSEPPIVVEAILEAGPGGRAERYVPRYYQLFASVRTVAPGLVRRLTGGSHFTPSSGSR